MTAHRLPPMPRPTARAARLLAALAVAAMPIAQAAQTQIADEPLITQPEFKPKPNVMVILDDSGSMNWSYMPDDLGKSNNATDEPYAWYGYKAAQCNGVAYDPTITYTPPLKANGDPYPDAGFTTARDDGYVQNGSPVNLMGTTNISASSSSNVPIGTGSKNFAISGTASSYNFTIGNSVTATNNSSRWMTGTITGWDSSTGVLTVNVTDSAGSGNRSSWTITSTAPGPGQFYYTYSGSQTAMNWTYTNGAVDKTTDFYKECATSTSNSSSVFTKVAVTASSAEATNYANWYSYYRKRYLLMRTAMGRAVRPLDDKYRLGFMTINQRAMANITPVDDFNTTNKDTFYGKLYGASANGSTPLLEALSTAGLYFARKVSGQTQATDPMQYACQRNFALLTTDGYWNGSNGTRLAGTGTLNTLAKVADHYYTTDLRTTALGNCTGADGTTDVCENILTPAGKRNKDDAEWQHMTTFTIGMGVTGTVPAMTEEEAAKYTQWPTPTSGTITTVDDLWYAAVKGRGEHYSAKNAQQLTTAIQDMVTAIQDVTGAGSATATSTLDLVQGDGNIAFEASYTTGSWFGDVQARELDSHTAAVKAGDPKWSARAKLDAKSAASRKIYFKNGTALSEFTWDNLTTALKANFQDLCASPARLTQCATLSTGNKTTVNGGAELVAYLRGDRTKEAAATNATAPLFRERKSVLGDIINSKPVHVGKPPFGYTDAGYTAFKTSQVNRKKVVYVGANDGMLHALDAATGEELWAYVPTAVMPNLYKLADVKYGSNTSQPHTYFVDGKTVQGDVYINGAWKTILVGGLNKGGRAYYALDVTDPDAPEALWEFTDDNLGLTYSDPVISKLADGTWTVAFGSGYNNVSPGDGKGRLFVVNAATGAVLRDIPTTAGSTATPSGMTKINVWVKALSDNTAQRFYAGDLLGNLWRFDVDDLVAPKKGALLLARMQDASGNAQPITTEPKLREYDKQPIVAVATGRYLGRDDIDDTQVQSIAAIRDPLTATGWGVVRTSSAFKKVTIAKTGTTASGAAVTVDWATGGGWWADLPTGGERVAMPMEWDGARLLAATTLPDGNQCKSGGASWLYSFGLAGGTTKGEQYSPDTLIVGFSVVTTDDGKPKIIVRTSGNKTDVKDGTGLGGGTTIKRARRVSWRELN